MSTAVATYQTLRQKYHDTAEASRNGNKQAFVDKAKLMSDVRAMERDAAREGTILIPTRDTAGKVQVKTSSAPSKRSLQEEYVRKFDDKKQVKIGDRVTNLREYHSERLLGK